MNEALKSYPAYEAKKSYAGLKLVRGVLHAALIRAAHSAVRLAARLEKVEAAVSEERVEEAGVAAAWSGSGSSVRFAEAVVGLAVVAYFVAGLVCVFVL